MNSAIMYKHMKDKANGGMPEIAPNLPFTAVMTLDQYLSCLERERLHEALTRSNWNYASAAKILDIGYRSMRYRASKCGIGLKHPRSIGEYGSQVGPEFIKEFAKVRKQVLERDGEICAACGATPENATIGVDHIKPVGRYPELALDPDNCQVLCTTCNARKGAVDETDYRIR